MKKVLQYGEGNFLRSFVDLYFETLNREGGEWAVEIVKPIPFGSLDAFARRRDGLPRFGCGAGDLSV